MNSKQNPTKFRKFIARIRLIRLRNALHKNKDFVFHKWKRILNKELNVSYIEFKKSLYNLKLYDLDENIKLSKNEKMQLYSVNFNTNKVIGNCTENSLISFLHKVYYYPTQTSLCKMRVNEVYSKFINWYRVKVLKLNPVTQIFMDIEKENSLNHIVGSIFCLNFNNDSNFKFTKKYWKQLNKLFKVKYSKERIDKIIGDCDGNLGMK